jgi:hypothetical protein
MFGAHKLIFHCLLTTMKRQRPKSWDRRRRIAAPYHVMLIVAVSILAAESVLVVEAQSLRGVVLPPSVTLRVDKHHHHGHRHFLRRVVSSSAPLRIENNAAAITVNKAHYRLRGVVRRPSVAPDSPAAAADGIRLDNQMKQHENIGALAVRINSELETRDNSNLLYVKVTNDEKTPFQTVLSGEGIDMMQIDLE